MEKVLIVTPGYHPAKNYGGPVISVSNIVANLGERFQFSIFTSNNEFKESARLVEDNSKPIEVGNAKVYYLDDNMMKKKYLLRLIKSISPDIVYINALFHYKLTLPILMICKQMKIPNIIAPRGGLCANALNFGRNKKIAYIRAIKFLGLTKVSGFQSTSPEETEAINKLFSDNKNRIYAISNLPAPIEKNGKKRVKKIDELKMVFFSRIHPKKNLKYAIECVAQAKGKINFDIYGPIEDQTYWNECLELIKRCPDNITIQYKGYLDHENIPDTLANYHVFFFPTLSENYGHVIVEALESGCLVLLSNNTPWNDVEDYNVGNAISLENRVNFIDCINLFSSMDQMEYDNCTEKIDKYLEEKLQIDKLIGQYTEMFKYKN